MRVIHFTEGAADPLPAFRAQWTRFVPLIDGDGDTRVSCLHLLADAQISEPPATHDCALLIVHGYVTFMGVCRLELSAGVGVVMKAGEPYSLESETGAIVLTIESRLLKATERGISTPARISGQRWPGEPDLDESVDRELP